jgi:hypothetical protein
MLAAPVRQCLLSRKPLPKTFLQQLRPVPNPTTGTPWLMPSELAAPAPDSPYFSAPPKGAVVSPEPPTELDPRKTPANPSPDDDGRVTKPHARGTVYYVLSHFDLIEKSSQAPAKRRREMAKNALGTKSVWREGMQDVVLGVMRDEIIHELGLVGLPERLRLGYLSPLTSLADVKDVVERGCVLWWGDDMAVGDTPGKYATLDLEGVLYGAKVPVHNLRVLLGDEHLEKLRGQCAFFREHGMAMLRRRVTLKTQLKLWRLQGYVSGEHFRGGQDQGPDKALEGDGE